MSSLNDDPKLGAGNARIPARSMKQIEGSFQGTTRRLKLKDSVLDSGDEECGSTIGDDVAYSVFRRIGEYGTISGHIRA